MALKRIAALCGKVTRADGEPWVGPEKAHAIAHTILADADTDADQQGGQVGLSFVEFMTCLEGDAVDFPAAGPLYSIRRRRSAENC